MGAGSDLAHKAFVSLLGGATAAAGIYLAATMLSGFSYHNQASFHWLRCLEGKWQGGTAGGGG